MTPSGIGRRDVLAALAGLVLAGFALADSTPAGAATEAPFGRILGHTFTAPALGFTLSLPDDFRLDLDRDKLTGATASGAEALRLDGVTCDAYEPLSRCLASKAIDGMDARSIETFSIRGITTATGRARSDGWTFRVFLFRLGPVVYRLIFSTRDLTPERDRAFRASALTFRRLTPA